MAYIKALLVIVTGISLIAMAFIDNSNHDKDGTILVLGLISTVAALIFVIVDHKTNSNYRKKP